MATYTPLEQYNHIRENNMIKTFSINLFCYQIDFYKDPKYCFSCFCFKRT